MSNELIVSYTQKKDFVRVANICDTDNRAMCSYTDCNHICCNNNYFLPPLFYFLVTITIF